MDDRSIIKPIISAMDYFNSAVDEVEYFYKIIDRFCAYWFGRQIHLSKLSNIELFLIHELLGEFLRFEENNKRVALWVLALNRICYNFSRDISPVVSELEKMNNDESLDIDPTLIAPILKQIKKLDELHKKSGKDGDVGSEDLIGNYLQWVMVYTGFVYPSLNDKFDFHEQAAVVKSMNYVLMEFIKQHSNDKRMAYLILGIAEACRQYSLQSESFSKEFIENYEDKEAVLAGQDEALVRELLNKLKNENTKQSSAQCNLTEDAPEDYIKIAFAKVTEEINSNEKLAVNNYSKYVLKFTSKFLSYDAACQKEFLKVVLDYSFSELKGIKKDVLEKLKKSIAVLPDATKKWLDAEAAKLKGGRDEYIEKLLNDLATKGMNSRFNFVKPFMLLLLSYKFEIL
jgi:hypothetical protein